MKTRYRIVADDYAGYEVQRKIWRFPLCWFQVGCNTHTTVERARAFIERVDFVEYH